MLSSPFLVSRGRLSIHNIQEFVGLAAVRSLARNDNPAGLFNDKKPARSVRRFRHPHQMIHVVKAGKAGRSWTLGSGCAASALPKMNSAQNHYISGSVNAFHNLRHIVSIVSCASKYFRYFWPIMKHLKCYLPLLALLLAGGGGQASDTPPAAPANAPAAVKPAADKNEVALIKTTEGDMVIAFWTDAAPKTIANFKKLARKRFYDGTAVFIASSRDFMIQGGDPLTKDAAAEDALGHWRSGLHR